MTVSMIAAMAHGRVIGANNDMPWHMPADLAHFKRTTLGKPVVMGRKTYESIGRALPGRVNIVITRDPNYHVDDAKIVSSPESALDQCASAEEIMVIGGGTIYQSFLPLCERLYLTEIDVTVGGDTFFPDYQAYADWAEVESECYPADDKNAYPYRFITLEKKIASV